jgi:hypothetical protein
MAAPFPTVSRVARLNGRYAIATVAGFTLTLHAWSLEVRTEFVDATGHSDIWDVPVPLRYSWSCQASGYFDTGTRVSYLHTGYSGQIVGTVPPDITPVLFSGYASADTSVPIFTGSGFLVRAHWNAPLALAEQELEIRGTGIPTTIP